MLLGDVLMSSDEINTLEKIMQEGKKEFLEKGFKDASLRNIVKRAGVTTGAFYGYYPNKTALFEDLVSPSVNGLKELFLSAQKEFEQFPMEDKQIILYDYTKDETQNIVDYIYENFDEFKLVVSCSEGTDFSDFIHDLVEIEVEYSIKFIESSKNDAFETGRASPELLHIISSAFFSGVFEIVKHDMSKEDADKYIDSLKNFFIAGWKTILKY